LTIDADVAVSMPELHVIDTYSKVEELNTVKDNKTEALPTPKMNVVAEPSKPIGELQRGILWGMLGKIVGNVTWED
jgi:hypothetical protein